MVVDKRKGGCFAATFLVMLIGIPVIMLEVGVRVFSPYGHTSPRREAERAFSYEGAVFARHVIKREAKTVWDGKISYPINSLGYRGPEFEAKKPEGVLRVMVFGGSGVFDLAADGYTSWPEKLGIWLEERLLVQVEGINAGISGHSSSESFGRLMSEGHTFKPDYVVLYNAWNDIKFFHHDEPLLRVMRPYRPDPRLVYHGWWDRALCGVSQLYVRFRNRYLSWKHRIGAEGAIPVRGELGTIKEEALAQYKLNLELFVECARLIGATPVLVTQARLATPSSTAEERKKIPYHYTAFDHDRLCEAFEATARLIRQVGHERGAIVVDAAPVMSGRDEYLYDHMHTTAEGSDVLAALVGEAILKRMINDK